MRNLFISIRFNQAVNCVQSSCQVLMNSEGRLIIFKGIAFKTQADAELISRLEFIQSIHLYVLLKRVRVRRKSYVQYCGCSCSNTRIYVLEKKLGVLKLLFMTPFMAFLGRKIESMPFTFYVLLKAKYIWPKNFRTLYIEWLVLCHL